MGQIKVYGLDIELNKKRSRMSDIIHSAVVQGLEFPEEKRFQRFFPLSKENFIYPSNRSSKYTIIEVNMFSGRSVEAKKRFIKLLYKGFKSLGIDENDLEITIIENPKENWGIRGVPGDELVLNYKVKI